MSDGDAKITNQHRDEYIPDYHKYFQRPITERFNSHVFVRSSYPGHENWTSIRDHVINRLDDFNRDKIGLIIVECEDEARQLYKDFCFVRTVKKDKDVVFEEYNTINKYDILNLTRHKYNDAKNFIYKKSRRITMQIFFDSKKPLICLPVPHFHSGEPLYCLDDIIAGQNETLATVIPQRFFFPRPSLFKNIIYDDIAWPNYGQFYSFRHDYREQAVTNNEGCIFVLVSQNYNYEDILFQKNMKPTAARTFKTIYGNTRNGLLYYTYSHSSKLVLKDMLNASENNIKAVIPFLPQLRNFSFDLLIRRDEAQRRIFDYQHSANQCTEIRHVMKHLPATNIYNHSPWEVDIPSNQLSLDMDTNEKSFTDNRYSFTEKELDNVRKQLSWDIESIDLTFATCVEFPSIELCSSECLQEFTKEKIICRRVAITYAQQIPSIRRTTNYLDLVVRDNSIYELAWIEKWGCIPYLRKSFQQLAPECNRLFPATERYHIRRRDKEIGDDDESDQDQQNDLNTSWDGQDDFDASPQIPTEIKELMLSMLYCLDTAHRQTQTGLVELWGNEELQSESDNINQYFEDERMQIRNAQERQTVDADENWDS